MRTTPRQKEKGVGLESQLEGLKRQVEATKLRLRGMVEEEDTHHDLVKICTETLPGKMDDAVEESEDVLKNCR